MENAERFEMVSRRWYAMLRVLPEGGQHPSPIWVFEAKGLHTGKGRLAVSFWHANYPEGVQDKVYVLRVLARERGYLLGQRLDETSGRPMGEAILLTEMTADWLEAHFRQGPTAGEEVQTWLDRKWGRPEEG